MSDYQITMTDTDVETQLANGDAHKELSQLIKYPPFSLYAEKRKMLIDSMTEASMENGQQMQKTGKPLENCYSGIMDKFSDDIDEARLYQKRYGDNWRDAQKAAMKIDKLNDNADGLYSEYY